MSDAIGFFATITSWSVAPAKMRNFESKKLMSSFPGTPRMPSALPILRPSGVSRTHVFRGGERGEGLVAELGVGGCLREPREEVAPGAPDLGQRAKSREGNGERTRPACCLRRPAGDFVRAPPGGRIRIGEAGRLAG